MKDDKNITIQQLKDKLYSFSKQRGWQKRYTPDTLAKSIVIEASELLELFQWLDNENSKNKVRNELYKKQIVHEMVDVLYYLLMLAHILKVDIFSGVEDKLEDLSRRYLAS